MLRHGSRGAADDLLHSARAPAGYALARSAFRGANIFRLLILVTRAFPVGILALPLAVTYMRLGIYDTVSASR